ncbi:MAG: hypothetical protein N0E54_02550 [Candidatus Thiodiazotropha taylori]|nr:hypothetical protein [Candidatus Thiodiazotropha endolucinida]MCW4227604.1 hypothetical protein [Candidatus Thiodiazotropha taylori]
MVVAQVSSVTWPEVGYTDPLISYDHEEFEDEVTVSSRPRKPNIVTRYHIGGVRANTLIVPLPPGDYTLEGLKRITGGTSYGTPYGTYSSTSYLTYPLNIEFKIESGRATNLGMIELEHIKERGERSFVTLIMDNSVELATYLEERHHEMFNSLENKEFIKGFEQTMTQEDLSRLRAYIVNKKINSKQWRYDHPYDSIVTGNAGTIARISRDSKGKLYIGKIYNPHSVADLSNCGVSGSRAVCIVSKETILLLNDDTIKWYTLPAAAPINSVSAFGRSGILLIDDSRRFHISYDNGENWTQYDGVVRQEPIERSGYKPIDMNSFGIYLGEEGYYVFEKNSDGPLVYADYEQRQHKKIALPKSLNNITQVEERAGKLFIGPERTEILHDELHFMSLSSKQWTVREIPTNLCSKMAILDSEANHIQLYCGERDVQVTQDQGETWTKQRHLGATFFDYLIRK